MKTDAFESVSHYQLSVRIDNLTNILHHGRTYSNKRYIQYLPTT